MVQYYLANLIHTVYTVKMTESDHQKAYQEYLKEKPFRTVVIYFAIKNKYVFIKYAVVIYVAMCCQSLISDAWVHAYINVQHICTPIRQTG